MDPANHRSQSSHSPGIEGAIGTLLSRRMSDGGFVEIPGGDYRPDATAWAILCLESFQIHPETVAVARATLAAAQLPNGSIPVAHDYPEAYWPTAAATMALRGDPQFSTVYNKAIDFLLATSGRQIAKEPDSPIGHDSTIPGWSWIDQTHSWVEPTAMSIRALYMAGKIEHERVREGVRLLLDRQLPSGGWNCGSTTIYGKVLNFTPTSTGIALWSLTGLTDQKSVNISLKLLQKQLSRLHTPLSLGWALLGLTAWNVATPNAGDLVAECLQRQGRYSEYGTSQLSILLTAAKTSKPTRNANA